MKTRTTIQSDTTRDSAVSAVEKARYILPAGTVLDGRYEIRRLVGQGGFGITYEAVHRYTRQRVAVKEYFCREYCGRDITAGGGMANSVYIVDETLAAQFRSDLDRFLKEARILHDFAAEPSIVTVLDYFEENGTAYIVMEYLDGVNLRDYVRDNGRWDGERAVRCFSPVMEAMEHVHAAGVLHRDISPDNLMYMPDGTLRLMDFGAARKFTNMQTTHSVIFKSFYSAPEQREEKGAMGSWTDVYGLCSTMYFCLTGQEPEDVLSRLLYDEMDPPSALGADLLPQAEKVLMKGLSLDWKERVQDMGSLRTSLEKAYPNLSEEEKEKEKARRRRARRMAAAAAAVLLIAAGCAAWAFRTRILFHFVETQVTFLDGTDMTPAQYADSAAKVRERVEAMAGRGRYLWSEEGGKIRFEVPAEIYGSEEPQDYVRMNISRQMILRLYAYDKKEEKYVEQGILSQTEDVEEVRKTDDGMEVRLTQSARERLRALLEEKGAVVRITYDELDDSGSRRALYAYQNGLTAGDGACLLIPAQEGASSYSIPFALDRLHYTQAPSAAFFLVHCPLKADWEDPESALLPGQNQKKEQEIPDPSVYACYKASLGSAADGESGYSAEMLSFQAVLKNRLDSIGVPYAVGTDAYDPSRYIVRLPMEGVWGEELELLGNNITVYIGSDRTRSGRYVDAGALEVLDPGKAEDGSYALRASFEGTYAISSAEEALELMRSQGKEKVFLYVGRTPVAVGDLGQALQSIGEDGTILFTEWADAGPGKPGTPMTASNIHFARFLSESLTQDTQAQFYRNRVEYTDGDGTLLCFEMDPPEAAIQDGSIQETVQEWEEKDENVRVTFDASGREATVTFRECTLKDPAASLGRFTALYPEAGTEEDGFREIELHLYGRDASEDSRISLQLQEDFSTGTKKITFGFLYWDDPAEAEQIHADYERYLREAAPWSEWIDPDEDEEIISLSNG